jgi:hypothetical protein
MTPHQAWGDDPRIRGRSYVGQRRHIRLGYTTAEMGGDVIIEDHGRTPGIQQNDALETFAVLQSLLNTHTADGIELYCYNQGFANI